MTEEGRRECSWVMEMLNIVDWVGLFKGDTFSKTHKNLHFSTCKFYFNKRIKKSSYTSICFFCSVQYIYYTTAGIKDRIL